MNPAYIKQPELSKKLNELTILLMKKYITLQQYKERKAAIEKAFGWAKV